jgi:hypothetical protein
MSMLVLGMISLAVTLCLVKDIGRKARLEISDRGVKYGSAFPLISPANYHFFSMNHQDATFRQLSAI